MVRLKCEFSLLFYFILFYLLISFLMRIFVFFCSYFFQLLKTRQFGYGELVVMSVFMSFIITTTVTFKLLPQLKKKQIW